MDLISREAVKENHRKWLGYLDEDMIARLNIAVDKHIPSAFEGMTCGEVIQLVFPKMPFELHSGFYSNGRIRVDYDTWNAPYKGVSE